MEGMSRETYPICAQTRHPPRVNSRTVSPMEIELDPPQPDAVESALAELLAAEEPTAPDPWWAEGLRESLES